MNIAMTGATGYIGKHLSNYLTEKGGHRIIPLGRAMFREGMSGLLVQTLTHCDVIINLAGAPINQRWTPEHKQELFNSRITVTHRIIRALNAVKTKPKLMISASAVGYYPSLVESDEYTQTRGDGFLSDLWDWSYPQWTPWDFDEEQPGDSSNNNSQSGGTGGSGSGNSGGGGGNGGTSSNTSTPKQRAETAIDVFRRSHLTDVAYPNISKEKFAKALERHINNPSKRIFFFPWSY